MERLPSQGWVLDFSKNPSKRRITMSWKKRELSNNYNLEVDVLNIGKDNKVVYDLVTNKNISR
jgi:hypothetical protein